MREYTADCAFVKANKKLCNKYVSYGSMCVCVCDNSP